MAIELDPLAGPDGGDEGRRLAAFWGEQLRKVRDDTRNKRWLKRGITIEKRYRDERTRTDEDGQRRYNALWTNVEILTPAIYSRCPLPIAERRFKDKDPVGRGAAQILERALRNEIEICGFDEALQLAVRDYLIAGRGTVWVRYEPEFEEGVSVTNEGGLDIKDDEGDIEPEDNDPEAVKLQQTGDRILRESTPVDYINWVDFITFPSNARTWREVTAVAKRVFMTRNQLIKRFGKVVGKEVPLRKDDRSALRNDGGPSEEPDDKGEVFEIWSQVDKAVFWVAEGYQFLLDRKDDPLKLQNFYPCPRPIFSNATTSTLVPVPDYIEYQDQAIQVDELTQRISMLCKACKVAGVYNAAAKDIQRLFNESVENELIPVDDWAAFAEKGGVAGNISFIPLKEIIGVINELQTMKEKMIVEMDQLTGITDIMRGTTDARETFGGQRLKTNNASTRLQRRQADVARFSRDTVRLMADIMSQHFSPMSLIEVSGAFYQEGLGYSDIDSFLQESGGVMPQTPMQFGGLTPSLPTMAPQVQAAPALPTAVPPGMPPQIPSPGNNVVPFPQAGQPPMPPQMGMGVQPPINPAQIQVMAALQRINSSIKLIRNEKLRGFRVDIEVDSTISGDSQQEKADRIQFITVVTNYLQQAAAMSATVPEMAPLLAKFLQFGVRGFRVGRDLESAIEEFGNEAMDLAKQKQIDAQKQPNPKVITAQATMLRAQTDAKSTAEKNQRERERLNLDTQESQQRMVADSNESAAEIERQRIENQGEAVNSEANLQMKQLEFEMKKIELQIAHMKQQTESMKVSRAATKGINDAMSDTGGNT